ncbi:hypothetical protein KC19_VG265800 [Ceratodon purpureus]|uniref:Uncharacterized protein n=1 Tax=Ceratodon purpureus TaxID=3225 RepID=A0A8T0HVE4_CERPU|nr:hypothetical protein KC19_VG265800 [Ceratodon purpureus]
MEHIDGGIAWRSLPYVTCFTGEQQSDIVGSSWYSRIPDCNRGPGNSCVGGVHLCPVMAGNMPPNTFGQSSNGAQGTSNLQMPVMSTYPQRPPYMWGPQVMYGPSGPSVMPESGSQMQYLFHGYPPSQVGPQQTTMTQIQGPSLHMLPSGMSLDYRCNSGMNTRPV